MHDFTDIFNIQLLSEQPLTAKGVNGILSLLSYNKTPREIMVESKKLKSKIGKRRVLFYVTHANPDGAPQKQKMEKVWEDEFNELQSVLADYVFTGHDGNIPCFVHKNIK